MNVIYVSKSHYLKKLTILNENEVYWLRLEWMNGMDRFQVKKYWRRTFSG